MQAIDFEGLPDRLAPAESAAGPSARRLVAVVGAPGSGKSSFAERLDARLNAARPGASQVLPMDGFHFDDLVLVERGDRPRKGAPHTFDVDGLAATLARLARDDGRDVAVPLFDRSIEIARAGARIIRAGTRLVIVEGNYLLLDDPAWTPLAPSFAATVFLDVPEPVLVERLRARWVGFGLNPAEIEAKLEGNDLPNMRLVLARSRPADFVLRNVS